MSNSPNWRGPLQKYSDEAARLLGLNQAAWDGFGFCAVKGEGVWVTGRLGKFGKDRTVFVPLMKEDGSNAGA